MPPSPSTSRISKRPPSTSPVCSWFCFGKIFESRGWPAAGVGDGSTNVRSPAAALESIGGADGPPTNVAPSSSRGISLAELSPLAGARTAACPLTPELSGLAFFGLGSFIQLLGVDLAHHYLPHPWERMLPSSSEKYIPIRTLGDVFVSMAPRHAPYRGRPKVKSADPAATATYCFPSTANDIGDEYTDDPHWKCQSALPVVAASAITFPSASPVNTSPPAVDRTPAHVGEGCFHSHLTFPVAGSSARSAPQNGCASSLGKYAEP